MLSMHSCLFSFNTCCNLDVLSGYGQAHGRCPDLNVTFSLRLHFVVMSFTINVM
jgi:hypothetical protein